TWEGHILRLQFWARAFDILKQHGAVFLQTEGKLAGCWVMKIQDEADAPAEPRIGIRPSALRQAQGRPEPSRGTAGSGRPERTEIGRVEGRDSGFDENDEEREKVIVRS